MLWFPPQLVGGLFPVVHEFGLAQSTCVHIGHKVFHLVIVGDHEPVIFALYFLPIQLACEGGDMRFRSVTPRRKDVVFGGQLFLGVNDIPSTELRDHRFYGLVFVTDAVFLYLLDVLCVDGRDDSFDRH